MIGEKKALEMIEKILWMTEEYVQIAAMPKHYGTGDLFHNLDIHIIHTIGKNRGINVTGLARKHSISKSAVSQAIAKLQRRGLVRRYQVPENRKEVLFELTDRGERAFEAHLDFHMRAETPYINELARFSREESAMVEKVIDLLMRRARHVRTLILNKEAEE